MLRPADVSDFYRPLFDIKLNGKTLRGVDLHSVAAIDYRDDLDALDGVSLTILNWDLDAREPTASEDDQWLPGKTLEVSLGYRDSGNAQLLFKGEIAGVCPTFPATGMPYLVVNARSDLAKLMTKQKTRVFLEKTDTEIAKTIAGELGLGIKTAPQAREPKHDYVLQWNSYDIVFLKGRASRLGYELALEKTSGGDAQLFIGQSQRLRRRAHALTYGKDLSSFEIELDTSDQVNQVTVRAWHPTEKEPISGSAKRTDARAHKALARIEGRFRRVFSGREEVITDFPVGTPETAKAVAAGVMNDIVQRMLTARGQTIGLPQISAGAAVEIDGVGNTYGGRYLVTSSIHTVDDHGYRTEFRCRREDA
jgi:phage protein D